MRWSDFPTCGEKRLICAVIAQAAADHQFYKRDFRAVANGDGFWGPMLEKYCRMISLDPQFVREQILLAATRDGDMVEVAA